MSIGEDLLQQLDKVVKGNNISRSAFIREYILHFLKHMKIKELEKKHREGYLKYPVQDDEFSVWESEQVGAD